MHDVCEVVATGLRICPHNRSWSVQDARQEAEAGGWRKGGKKRSVVPVFELPHHAPGAEHWGDRVPSSSTSISEL